MKKSKLLVLCLSSLMLASCGVSFEESAYISFGEDSEVTSPTAEESKTPSADESTPSAEESKTPSVDESTPSAEESSSAEHVHSWGDWEVTKEATCQEKGEEARECESCHETETRETELADHSYGEWETVTAPDKGEKGQDKRVCSVCQHEETRDVEDTGVYSDSNWKVAGVDSYAYQYVDGNVVNRNKETMNSQNHLDIGSTNMNIYQGETPEFWSVSCKFKGTISESLTGDNDVYTGLVFDYVDEDNYLGLIIRWTTWDRPQEVRSFYFFSVIDGEYRNLGDNWTDGCDLKPSSSIELTITKSITLNGYVYEANLSGKGGTYTKSAKATVDFDNKGKVGLMGANDKFTYSNFAVTENTNVTKTIGYSCGDDTVTLNYYDHTYTLTGSQASTGTYKLSGKTVTLTPAEGDEKILTLVDDSTFEYYVAPSYTITHQLAANESVDILSDINGDFTIAFNYIGTKASGFTTDDKVGLRWYQDENNYLDAYVQWGENRGGNDEVRQLSINGMINGEFTGWFDIWTDGFTNLPCDGGKVIVKKVDNTFTIKLISGDKSKEDSKTFTLPEGNYDVQLFTSGTDFGFYNVSHELAAGQADTILADTYGDFSVSFDYYGAKSSGFTTDDKVGVKVYYDDNNYLDAYVQWGENRGGNDEVRQLSINGNLNGEFTGWFDIWTDGFTNLPYDGGTVTVSKAGDKLTIKLVSGDKTKEDSKTFTLPEGTYDVKVYASGTDFSISNISYNLDTGDSENQLMGLNLDEDFHVSFDAQGTIATSVEGEVVTGLFITADDDNYVKLYCCWESWDRAYEIRNLEITGKMNGSFVAGSEWHDFWVDANGINPCALIHYDITKSGTKLTITIQTGEVTKTGELDITEWNSSANYSFYLFGWGDNITITNLVY